MTWMILLVLLLKRPNSQYSSRSKYWGGLSIHPLLSLGLRQGLCGEGGGLSLSQLCRFSQTPPTDAPSSSSQDHSPPGGPCPARLCLSCVLLLPGTPL